MHDLVAEGLDTVAHVTLNGVEIARTRNQHRTYRWRVDGILREGENRLRVEFASPIAYAREREAVLGNVRTRTSIPSTRSASRRAISGGTGAPRW